jgi:hypothetical protein
MAASAERIGLTGGELSLVHESNRAIRRVIEACGGVRTKTFRGYGKMVAQEARRPGG